MPLTFSLHKKIVLRNHPEFNEAWLHDRIADDPSILGLGDIRVLDRERVLTGGGRLDMLLLDEDNNRRFEVEIMLGATNPNHIMRAIEYWDLERRRYPGYDHVAVIIAENITTRFLNLMSLFAGSISLIAIQLNAIEINDHILLNFIQILDQTELRTDDTGDNGGGGQVDRAYWNNKVGSPLMKLCDSILETINENARAKQQFNYLRGYIGLQTNGVVGNFIILSPKPTKQYVHIVFKMSDAETWVQQFHKAGAEAHSSKNKKRMRLTVSANDFQQYRELIKEAVVATVNEFEM